MNPLGTYNYYPMSAAPTYNAYMPPYMRTQPTTSTGINWVLGMENAKSFYVEPGKSAILMDSEKEMFYLKSVDANGMATLKAFTFTEYVEPKTPTTAPVAAFDPTNFVTKEELATALE